MSDTPKESELETLAKAAQDTANSWTVQQRDAVWVASEAIRRRDEYPRSGVSHDIHRELWERRGWYPSAVEVGAICKAAWNFGLPSEAPK